MTEILFMDDMTTDKEINHDKLMEILSKAPKRQLYEKNNAEKVNTSPQLNNGEIPIVQSTNSRL